MPNLQKTDKILNIAAALVLALTVFVAMWSQEFFELTYAREDGPIEWATAILLFVSSLVLWRNMKLLSAPSLLALGLTVVYGLMFFLAAGEEISWGQRIFGWESSAFFQENNYQAETNIHNMVVGDVHLAEQVFGQALSVIILLYLVVLPFTYKRFAFLNALVTRMAIPVPRPHHAVLAIAASVIIATLDAQRKWEIYELCFSLFALSIFLKPANEILRKDQAAE